MTERERERYTYKLWSGEYADLTDVDCPRARCDGKVVYNGNYFCEFWNYLGDPPRARKHYECDWALGATTAWEARELYGGVLKRADVRVWNELRRTYRPLIEHQASHDDEGTMTDEERQRAERVAAEAEAERLRLLAVERRRELELAEREQAAVDEERKT